MRHLELQDGSSKILHEGVVVGMVVRRIQTGLDAGHQGIQAVAHERLFTRQPIEL